MMTRRGSATADEGRGSGALDALLERWQRERDADALDAIVSLIRGPLARVVAHVLRRHGIHDPGACDDAMSLVFDRLRRLGDVGGVPSSARFESARRPSGADAGWAYVRCLARSRARDVARSRRRRARRAAALASDAGDRLRAAAAQDDFEEETERLRAAVAGLDDRSRTIVELLLDGKSQAVIAHVLGVCEGTVSRLRTRAIADLRAILAG